MGEEVEMPNYAPSRQNMDVQLSRNLFVRLCTDDLKAYCLSPSSQNRAAAVKTLRITTIGFGFEQKLEV